MTETYQIRVSDRLGPALRCAFTDVRTVAVPRRTVIEGWLSADEFRALLLRIGQVGVELVSVQCAAPPRPNRRPG
jgi:hypothetical protein